MICYSSYQLFIKSLFLLKSWYRFIIRDTLKLCKVEIFFGSFTVSPSTVCRLNGRYSAGRFSGAQNTEGNPVARASGFQFHFRFHYLELVNVVYIIIAVATKSYEYFDWWPWC